MHFHISKIQPIYQRLSQGGSFSQGGSLSPILWCIVVDSLLVKMEKERIFAQGYSDDSSILISGYFESTVGDLIRRALKLTEEWCRKNNLSINPGKTKLILLSKRRNIDNINALVKLTPFGTDLILTDTVEFLGAILNSKLSWIHHLNTKINKAFGSF